MRFYSTNKESKNFSFSEVLRLGLAPDGGLFMPEKWPKLKADFLKFSFHQIALKAAQQFVSEIPLKDLKRIISGTFNFPAPLKHLVNNIYVLELFHGPTLAFKDFGARFLSRSLGYFLKNQNQILNIIVATSGDTGSAVAAGFFKVPNIRVFILYPSGKVSRLQEKQLTTYGHNITAIEVKGTFDDCQKLAKKILSDKILNKQMLFSSANSINFGRLLPQSFYYFWAYSQLEKFLNPDSTLSHPSRRADKSARYGTRKAEPVFVVPSGNFGNLFAGLMAKKMGLPVYKFVAATNANNTIQKYLDTGKFFPKKSKTTISNAMDVGNPSNFARMLEMYNNNHKAIRKDITAFSVSDTETKNTIRKIYHQTGYVCDPHTAVGIKAAWQYQKAVKNIHPVVVLSTAHPAKFREVIEPIIRKKIKLPKQLIEPMKKKKQSIKVSTDYNQLKKVLFSI